MTLPPNPKQLFGDKKPPLDEFPLSAMIHASLAHLDGDNKYGFRNWRTLPVQARTYIKGALRHIRLFEEGEDYTRDSIVHNLGAAIAGLAIIIDAQVTGNLIDDRVPNPAVCDLLHSAEAHVEHLNKLQALRDGAKAGTLDDLDGAIAALNASFRARHLSDTAPRASLEEQLEALGYEVVWDSSPPEAPIPVPVLRRIGATDGN